MYPKLHGQSGAVLLDVQNHMRDSLPESFVEYDTQYYDGTTGYYHYGLPPGQLLVLVFIGNNLIPFTTVRRWTPENQVYYKSSIGKYFQITITEA